MTTPAIFELFPSALLGKAGESPFLSRPTTFLLPSPGVYTLEGPNGAGKSMFARLLTGTLPGQVTLDQSVGFAVDGRRVAMRESRDALSAGVVAIHQDDDLISSMTVEEHLALRHSTPNPRNFLEFVQVIVYKTLTGMGGVIPRTIVDPLMSPRFKRLFDKLQPRDPDWRSATNLRSEAEILLNQYGISKEILDVHPTTLSGGGRAAVKLISALLHKNVRVLILDEAFNSVEKNIWPAFQDGIKQWCETRGVAVLAISHNGEEISRWDPVQSFQIHDGILINKNPFVCKAHRRIAPADRSYPIFEIPLNYHDQHDAYYQIWKMLGNVNCVYLHSSDVKTHPRFTSLFEHSAMGSSRQLIELDTGPGRQVRPGYFDAARILGDTSSEIRAVAVCGNIDHINIGCYLVATSAHSKLTTILVPTTLTAIIASVLSQRFSIFIQPDLINDPKMTAGIQRSAFFRPAGVVVDPGFLVGMSQKDLRSGVVYCLRIGLLHDLPLFEACNRLLLAPVITAEDARQLVLQVISITNDVADVDPVGTGLTRVWSFGDLHASAIAESIGEYMSTESFLLLGMLIESILSDAAIKDPLAKLYRFNATLEAVQLNDWEKIEAAYRKILNIPKGNIPKLRCLAVNDIGQFNVKKMRSEVLSSSDFKRRKARSEIDMFDFAKRRVEGSEKMVEFYTLRACLTFIERMSSNPVSV
jgi:ABC-type multidrug transport system ATPase subunit